MSNPSPNPARVVLDFHELGAQLGYSRTRVDRSSLVVDSRRVWFEVGYSHREVHMRSSWAKFALRYPIDKVDWDEVRSHLEMGAASVRQGAK